MQSEPRHVKAYKPAHWLLLLRWFVTTPQHLKHYLTTLTSEGLHELRRATTWTVTSLCFIPLFVLSIYAGLQPNLMAKLAAYAESNRDGVTLWVSQHWYVVPLALVGCWVGTMFAELRAHTRLAALFAVAASSLATLVAALLSGWLLGSIVLGLSVAPTCGLACGLAQRLGSKPLQELTARFAVGLILGVVAAFALGLTPDPLALSLSSIAVFALELVGVYKLLDWQYKHA